MLSDIKDINSVMILTEHNILWTVTMNITDEEKCQLYTEQENQQEAII